MNQIANLNSEVTMSSLDFLNQFINPARQDAGEPVIENRHFIARVVDEIDDLGIVNLLRNPAGGRPAQYYVLNMEQMTLVGMRESKAVRRAVLEKLKQLSSPKLPDFTNPAEAARAWADQVDSVMQLESKIAADAPKVDFAERVEKSSGVLIGQFAKAIGVGQNRLFAWMRANGYLIATAGSRYNTPYQKHLERGYFDVTEGSYDANGETRTSFTTHITGKGQLHITAALKGCGMIGEVE